MHQRTKATKSEIAVLGIRGIPANYGGFETCAEQITRIWAEQGHPVLVYCRRKHYPQQLERVGNVRLKYTYSVALKSFDTLSHTLFSVLDLLIFERKVKLVHLYNTGNGIFVPLLRMFGKRVIVSGDGVEWRRAKWGAVARFIHKAGARMAALFADKIVVDNEEVRKYYAAAYKAEPALIAYGAKLLEGDAVRSAEVLEKYGLERKKYFLFVGRLVPEKGVHKLIEAYKRLNTDYPLVIIGDDVRQTAYRDELFRHQSQQVRFLGFVYGEDYEQLLSSALVYVSASSLEGTSPSLLAAMGARVCPLVNGIEENHAATQGAALMFKKNNYEDLQEKWQQVVDEPAVIDEWAEKAYRHVVDNYRWDAVADQYLSIFRQLAPKSRAIGNFSVRDSA